MKNLEDLAGDVRFRNLLWDIGLLHSKKQLDYGAAHDPFANIRSSQDFGVEPWIGALIRLNDKVNRLKQFALKGQLANESAEDSMMDIAVYALIALIFYREAAHAETKDRDISDPQLPVLPQASCH